MNETDTTPEQTELVLAVLRAQDAAGNAFESTGVQLSRLVLMLEDPADPLAGAEKPAAEWHAEVFRRLITFLNAAHDLTVYARQMAEMSGSADAPPVSPAARFLEELRSGMKHRRSPVMRLETLEPPATKLRVLRMNISEMLFWPNWSPPALQFLHQHQPELPLFTAVHEYQQALRMFRQRALRDFRQKFADILTCAPCQPVMMQIM